MSAALNCFAYLYAALLAHRRSDSVEMESHSVKSLKSHCLAAGQAGHRTAVERGDIDWPMPNCEHCFDSA